MGWVTAERLSEGWDGVGWGSGRTQWGRISGDITKGHDQGMRVSTLRHACDACTPSVLAADESACLCCEGDCSAIACSSNPSLPQAAARSAAAALSDPPAFERRLQAAVQSAYGVLQAVPATLRLPPDTPAYDKR